MSWKGYLEIVAEIATVVVLPISIWAALKANEKAATVYDLIRLQQLQSQQTSIQIFTGPSQGGPGSPLQSSPTSLGNSAGQS